MANNQQRTNIYIDGSQAGSTLVELKKKVAVLNREIKDLPRNSDAYKAKLKDLSQASQALDVHKNQIRGIGDSYAGANKGIGGMMRQFAPMAGGLAIAGAAISGIIGGISSWYQNNKQMEKSLSSLQSLTGASTEDLKFYKQEAIEMGKASTVSASQAVEAFKLIGSARPDLLKNKEALAEVTKQTIVLAEASEMDLGASATSLAGAMNQFNLSAEHSGRIINALAAGSKEGAAEVSDVTQSIEKFGAVAQSNNVTFEESVALTEVMAEKNIKGAEAGTQLRNVLLTVATAASLPKEAQDSMKKYGVNLDIVSDKSLPLKDRLNELKKVQGDQNALVKIFGKENVVAGQTILGNVEKFDTLTKAVTGTNTAYEQQAINNDNLDGNLKKLGSAWEAYTLKLGSSGGGLDSLNNGIKFLSENLEDVIGFVGKIVVAFVTFKAITTGVKTAQLLMNAEFRASVFSFRDLSKSAKGAGDATKDAGAGAGKFAGALKAIGWTAIIAVVSDVAMEFWDVASGAAAARYQTELYNKYLETGNKFGTESVKRIQDGFETSKQSLDLKIAEGKITKKQYEDEIKLLNQFTDNKIKAEIQLANESKKAAKQRGDKGVVAGENATLKELISLQKDRANASTQSKIEELNNDKEVIKSQREVLKNKKEANKTEIELQRIIDVGTKLQAELKERTNKQMIDSMEEGIEKELYILTTSLDEKYQAEIQSAINLMSEKGEIGLKATEQYNRLIAMEDQDYEQQKAEIEKKFRDKKNADDLEADKNANLQFIAQQETLQDALADLKVTKAKIALNAVLEGDLSGYRLAKVNLEKALQEQAELEKTRKIEALMDLQSESIISAEELNVRKEELELEYQARVVEIGEETAEKLKEIDDKRLEDTLANMQEVVSIASSLSDFQSKIQLNKLDKAQKIEMNKLNNQLRNKSISEEEYNSKKKKIDEEYAQKKYEVELEAFKKNQAFASAEAIIQGALAIAKVTAQTGVLAPIPIALVIASTAAQLLQIAAQTPPEAPQFVDGGYSDVIGKQDGLRYRAKNVGRMKAGLTPMNPSLALVSEKGPEYFVPNGLLRNQRVARHVAMIDAIRTNQYVDGGFTQQASLGSNDELTAVLKQNNQLFGILAQTIPTMGIKWNDGDTEDLEKNQSRLARVKN